MKIYVVGPSKYYTRFIENAELTDNLKEAQIVLFTGGEDVDPCMYGKKRIAKNIYSNIHRDIDEKNIFNQISENQLVVGVCRGSQFLCTINGGNLVQDCDKHALSTTHTIYSTKDKIAYMITSTHHQMQDPYKLPKDHYEVLYVAHQYPTKIVGDDLSIDNLLHAEPEVVLYTVPGKPKCLAIQGHPEMMPDSPVAKMLSNLIKSYVSK